MYVNKRRQFLINIHAVSFQEISSVDRYGMAVEPGHGAVGKDMLFIFSAIGDILRSFSVKKHVRALLGKDLDLNAVRVRLGAVFRNNRERVRSAQNIGVYLFLH